MGEKREDEELEDFDKMVREQLKKGISMTKDEIIKDLFDLVKVSFQEYSINKCYDIVTKWENSQSFKDLDFLKFKYKEIIENENIKKENEEIIL